ncbi:MAG: hypothetical protein M9888_07825 [Chitinophagales bacterium]|nr:hypothetical protein [Chitinophagales bacterium]
MKSNFFTHRITKLCGWFGYQQTGLLSKQLGRNLNHLGRRFGNTTSKKSVKNIEEWECHEKYMKCYNHSYLNIK